MKTITCLVCALVATGFAAPITDKRDPITPAFPGIYIGPGEEGESAVKAKREPITPAFPGIYIGPGEEGDAVEMN